jgi:hypothetical protein
MNRWTNLTLGASLILAACTIGTVQAQSYAPAGSYQQSCQNIRVRGDELRAECTNTSGQYVRSSLALNACGNGDIANYNGQLTCARTGGYGRGAGYYGRGNGYYNGGSWSGIPGGSYQQSCTNARMNGSVLVANCTNDGGRSVRSFLDMSRCGRSDDVANIDGQLRCRYH